LDQGLFHAGFLKAPAAAPYQLDRCAGVFPLSSLLGLVELTLALARLQTNVQSCQMANTVP